MVQGAQGCADKANAPARRAPSGPSKDDPQNFKKKTNPPKQKPKRNRNKNLPLRACVELGGDNPLVQIHDQGAGGNCNVVKEIVYPLGGEIDVRSVKVGDATMSVLEIWGAEYQENDCLLIRPESRALLEAVCARERCLMQVRFGFGFGGFGAVWVWWFWWLMRLCVFCVCCACFVFARVLCGLFVCLVRARCLCVLRGVAAAVLVFVSMFFESKRCRDVYSTQNIHVRLPIGFLKKDPS